MVPHLIRRLRRDPLTEMPTPVEEPEEQKPLYPVVGCDGSVSVTLNFGATLTLTLTLTQTLALTLALTLTLALALALTLTPTLTRSATGRSSSTPRTCWSAPTCLVAPRAAWSRPSEYTYCFFFYLVVTRCGAPPS